jgi:hypothetical protein
MLAFEFIGFLAKNLQRLVLIIVTEEKVRFMHVVHQTLQTLPIFNRPAVNHPS